MDAFLSALDKRFAVIDARSRDLLARVPNNLLYQRPRETRSEMAPFSCGEYILRSAAMVEKTFGGITTRLWDDPFEWTLPEKLVNKDLITAYLDEVEATRLKGFSFFTSDQDLKREIPAPETLRSLSDILIETIGLASHFQGRAFALFQALTDEKLPQL
ncbi:MAG TPA: hypothetical protein PLL77_04560 [Pyrinomonadaceae bacterium]|nr:hypothetical protein [Pyrinomonadaceae bacterium]